jgi:hypothetical protein
MEYYPEDALQLASQNPKFAAKVEDYLADVVLKKSSRSFVNLSGERRNFLMMYVYEHFKLDMCTYGGKAGSNSVTDVYWKEGCRVPEIMAAEVVVLIKKGIMSSNLEENRNLVFEATINIYDIPKGSTVQDVKSHLKTFQNEFYTERRNNPGQARSAQLHFYTLARAKDAHSFLRNSAHQFNTNELIVHKKEVGVNGGLTPAEEEKPKKSRSNATFDDDGFEIVKRP